MMGIVKMAVPYFCFEGGIYDMMIVKKTLIDEEDFRNTIDFLHEKGYDIKEYREFIVNQDGSRDAEFVVESYQNVLP